MNKLLKQPRGESDQDYQLRIAKGIHKLMAGVLVTAAWKVGSGGRGANDAENLFRPNGPDQTMLRDLDDYSTDYVLFQSPYDLNYGFDRESRDVTTSATEKMKTHGLDTGYMARWEKLSDGEKAMLMETAKVVTELFKTRGKP